MSQATIYDISAIQTMHMENVNGYQFLNDSLLQSGIVTKSKKLIGHVNTHQILSHLGSGQFVISTISTEIKNYLLITFYFVVINIYYDFIIIS